MTTTGPGAEHPDLMAGPPPTRLPEDPAAERLADPGADLADVAASHPESSLAWAMLAERELAAGDPVAGYAYARTGYHRGLDALRRAGWKGHGPIPWEHQPNHGFLRALAALCRAAGAIGEQAEEARCREFLRDSDPAAEALLG